ncbi:hypothetical protein F2Q69_00042644 [Brassica cretica]|uniref:Uncharacterized protein n=1 Tax=Brassica cretica TaxID=69181 RepID=A0A8S9N3B4_BRACR|nr:hypothetical protein F2Q69_00042644 [Brassica cretica]
MHGFVSYRRFRRARSQRSDRTERTLIRYVATERDGRLVASDRVERTLGRYVVTEQDVCSVVTYRPSLARARSLRSDRATFFGLFYDVSCFFRMAFSESLMEFYQSMGVYEYSIRTYSVPFFSRNRMIDSPSRFEDDAWTVIWLFPGSELDMRGDRFLIFGEFRSVCKIWTNSYETIYRDRKIT